MLSLKEDKQYLFTVFIDSSLLLLFWDVPLVLPCWVSHSLCTGYREEVVFSFHAASGWICYCKAFMANSVLVSDLSWEWSGSGHSMISKSSSGASLHILVFFFSPHFLQQLIFFKVRGVILSLQFQNKGITYWTLLLTWACSKSWQHTENCRFNSLLFLVTLFT